MKFIKNKKFLIIIIFGFILILLSVLFYYNDDEKNKEEEITLLNTTTTTIKINDIIYVDVKGNVKNPGVYEFKNNDRVIDAIEKAGGLTKNANTNNINLSQKLVNEMVVYVYSNTDIKNGNKILDCSTICETNIIEVNNCVENNDNKLVNINTANIEELLTLTGIGESKAQNIIEYREKNGKFETIEDLKNISGIGDSLFEKIKDEITV